MTHSPPSKPLNFFRRALPLVALALSAGFAAAPAWAQTAPRAGSSIGNQATATYNDGSQIERSVQSNSVTTTVQQVAAVTLVANRDIKAAPGSPVAFPHTVTNTGNGIDSFTLAAGQVFGTNTQIYADANQDGVPDNTTPISVTPSLAPGEKFNFVVVGTVPATQAAGSVSSLDVTATSVFAPGTAAPNRATNTDRVTVSTNATIALLKSVSGPSAGGVYTYTVRYTNNSNVAAGTVAITDAIDSRLAYVPGSGRWSVSGNGTPLTDNTGAPADPTGINYDVQGQNLSATITSVPGGTTGTISFGVTLRSNIAPGPIPNTARVAYDDDNDNPNGNTPNATPPVQDTSNTVNVNAAQAASVTISSANAGTVPQGSIVSFTNVVTNTGNGTDTFNITVDRGCFPVGTTFQLFQTDGAAALLDSNGDGIPDTGPINAGTTGNTYSVVVKAKLPANVAGGPFVANVRATSVSAPGVSATGTDTVNAVTAATVDITNRNGLGAGANDGQVKLNVTGAPGTVVTIPLSAINTSNSNNTTGINDNYALTVAGVPAGYSVVFKDANGQIITNTGNVAPGGTFDYVAEVTIPAGAPASATPINLTFTVTSGASGATDSIIDSVTVSTVRAITVTPNNQGQVFPGSSVNYSHTITNNGNAAESIALALADNPANSGFSSVVYFDTNGNGILDGTEGDAPVTAAFTLNAGESRKVIVKVFGPSNQFTSGAVNTTTLTATATQNGADISASATDTTTIVAGDVTLAKSQSVLNADGTATSFTNTQGNATALPGQIIRYTILVRNTGGADVQNVIVRDTTPAFTKYTSTLSAASFSKAGGNATTTGVTTPASGAAGTVVWEIGTLTPGQTATVTFDVKIDG